MEERRRILAWLVDLLVLNARTEKCEHLLHRPWIGAGWQASGAEVGLTSCRTEWWASQNAQQNGRTAVETVRESPMVQV